MLMKITTARFLSLSSLPLALGMWQVGDDGHEGSGSGGISVRRDKDDRGYYATVRACNSMTINLHQTEPAVEYHIGRGDACVVEGRLIVFGIEAPDKTTSFFGCVVPTPNHMHRRPSHQTNVVSSLSGTSRLGSSLPSLGGTAIKKRTSDRSDPGSTKRARSVS